MKKKGLIIILAVVLTLVLAVGAILVLNFTKANKWETVKKATCETAGEEQRTDLFGRVLETKVIPPLGHNYKETEVKASCTKGGYNSFDCSRCKSQYISDFTPAQGHDYGEWTTVEAATCSKNGYEEQTCGICNYTNVNILKSPGHSFAAVDSKVIDSVAYTYFECEFCHYSIELKEGETIEEKIGSSVVFDKDTSFSFQIKTDNNEKYIKENLKIIDAFFEDTDYEDSEASVQPYVLTDNGGGVWTVSHADKYDYKTTYLAKLSGDVEFVDYTGNILTFTTLEDENHVDIYEYDSEILFLKQMEQESAGYYPYTLVVDENSEYIYLTVGKADGLEVGKIICVGEVASADELTADTECCLGKIDSMYQLVSGEWLLMLTEPETSEIFSQLDLSMTDELDLSGADYNMEQIKKDLVDAFMASDESAEFFASVSVAANEYIADRRLDLAPVSSIKSFLDKIKIEPELKFEGNKMIATLNGELKIPLTDQNKTNIGNITVGFVLKVESEFGIDLKYELKSALGIPYDINYFDISLLVTDVFDFKFEISIDVDYSLAEDRYIKETESGKIHRRGCNHLTQITDMSKVKGISVKEAEKQIKEKAKLECKHCKPVEGFKYELLVINKEKKVIHAYNCTHVSQIIDANKEISDKNHTHWMDQGYTCCDWCHPENREQFDFRKRMIDSLEYSDWKQTVNDISQYAKDAGIKEHAKKGITLMRCEYPVAGIASLNFQVDFVFSFKLDASVSYEYSYTCSNRFGYRVQGDGVVPYSSKTSKELKNDLTLMGKAEIKAGFLLDTNISIVGLSQWARVGFTAEVGLYAELAGVLHLSSVADKNYAAARFEMGIYLDIDVYYKLFERGGELSIYSTKFPLLTMGYDKAYYRFIDPVESVKIDGNYDLSRLMTVEYFDLKSMTVKTEKLNVNGVEGLYTVTFSLENGDHFSVKDGVLTEADVAPCRISDTLTIKVEGLVGWLGYKKGSGVFYLKEYKITVDAENTVHTVEDIEGTPATCTSEGKTPGKVCTVCQMAVIAQITVPKTAHAYDDATDDTCNDCGRVRDLSCKHLNKEVTVGIAVGCMSYGIADGEYCPDCDEILVTQTVIEPLGHDICYYDAKVPTCTEVGWEEYEACLRGDYTTYKEIAALGHVYVDGECIVCEFEYPASEGLRFTSYGDGTCYVSGIGDCVEADIHIPVVSPDGDKVVAIGSRAFDLCLQLRSVTCYPGIERIESNAFDNCALMRTVVLPETVTEIGSYAFSNCAKLESINIPEGVTVINSGVFSECDVLELTLHDGITAIDRNAFRECEKLMEVENGVSYVGKWVVDCDTSVSSATVKEGTVGLANYAFSDCDSLEQLSLPDSIKYMSSYSIAGCRKLESIKIPSGITEVVSYAFEGCSSLKSVELHDGITSIGNYAFKGCSGLLDIKLPESLENIGISAFDGCTRLSVNVYGGAYYLGNDENPHLALVMAINDDITSCEIHEETKIICAYAFYECDYLTKIEIPDSVMTIGSSAFSSCNSLESVKISYGVEHIGDYAFSSCPKLISISIPDSVQTQGRSVFYNCNKLASVMLSSNITEIGDDTFYNCPALKEIDIPDSVERIGERAFYGCSSLERVDMSGYVTSVGDYAFDGCASLKEISLPDSLEAISTGMFTDCAALEKVTLENGLKSIGNNAFSGCASLKEIKLPESVEYIGSYAFYRCVALKEIYIPSKVRSVEEAAFSNCTGLVKITFAPGSRLTAIKKDAFYSCESLENISIPPRVDHLGTQAFYRCSALQSVTFLGNNQLESIPLEAFAYCGELSSINIPNSVKEVSYDAFKNCSKLFKTENGLYYVDKWVVGCDTSVTEVIFRSDVAGIADKAFEECESIVSVTVPDSVKGIGSYAFRNCTSLVSIKLPEGITGIGWMTFYGCSSLQSIALPEGVTRIEDSAFSGCSQLRSVYLPKSISSVGYSAFSSCSSLLNVYYGGSKEQWEALSIDRNNDDLAYHATVSYNYVP